MASEPAQNLLPPMMGIQFRRSVLVLLGPSRLLMRTVVWLLLTGVMAGAQSSPPPRSSAPQRDAAVVIDFEGRVAQYMKLRTKEAGKSPKPTAATDKLANDRDQMANSIREVRSGARQGDIFTEPVARYFRRQIAATLHGPQGPKIRASLNHAEPLRGISLRVNEPYPQALPLQSTPPSLLLSLPTLPKELQYRIVDSDLVLLDTAPNIVVDYIPHGFPAQ